ncbi:hypothetical protein GY15_31945 [Delftia sp. 670]|jgi:hypothetical protein|uniref:hypothetical protein n=1 Tax=Delftia TaxID=80865 RepID=UPI0004D762CA|nr:hypothetical protein [Delftia lacustris]KEH08869.1 hypothetical protein GY15_31945 [Delftia sp. 670]
MYIDKETQEFGLTAFEIMQRHPDTIFPTAPFVPLGKYAIVEESPHPVFDSSTQKLAEITPVEIDGVWRQQWSVVPLSEEELAELQRQRDEAAAALIPKSCTRRQGQLALLTHGVLDDAEAAIAAITDPVQKREAQIEYEADTWERANPFLQQLWAQLGGTPQSLDEAFALAVTL